MSIFWSTRSLRSLKNLSFPIQHPKYCQSSGIIKGCKIELSTYNYSKCITVSIFLILIAILWFLILILKYTDSEKGSSTNFLGKKNRRGEDEYKDDDDSQQTRNTNIEEDESPGRLRENGRGRRGGDEYI